MRIWTVKPPVASVATWSRSVGVTPWSQRRLTVEFAGNPVPIALVVLPEGPMVGVITSVGVVDGAGTMDEVGPSSEKYANPFGGVAGEKFTVALFWSELILEKLTPGRP